MSRFAEVIAALRPPLERAGRGPQALARVRDLGGTLESLLRRGAGLAIPAEARRRFARAAELLGPEEPDAECLVQISRLLGPLLEEDWALRRLEAPTERVGGIGPKIAAALARKEIHSIEDLLFFLPRAYEDRRNLLPIEALEVGRAACFEGRVTRAGVVPLRRGRRFFQVVVADATGSVGLKWFRGIAHFQQRIRPGARLLVAGDVRRYRFAKELHHPDIEVLDEDAPLESLPRIVPSYSAVEGLAPRSLRRVVLAACEQASDLVEAHLPGGFVDAHLLPEVGESLRQVHAPGPSLDPDQLRERRTPYHVRLVAEELFLLQAGLELRRGSLALRATRPLCVEGEPVRLALESLPFRLTADQRRAWREIAADVARPHPMNRLVLGDVGTGKTVLAFLAAVAARASGGLTAVLAPTEILAEQHLRTFRALAGPRLPTALLTGSTPQAERRQIARLVRLGEVGVLVGTHALLSEGLELPELRLVVIDEQHRFGVAQRRLAGLKGDAPHLLVMTATPIPRTLALTLFGDLDHSLLRERPPGRAPVTTRVVPRSAARSVVAEMRRTLARGEQLYVVYPLVEESEKQDLSDATRGFERLQKTLAGHRLALVHGRMDARDRTRAMEAFGRGEIEVLVSTTVIEVGVDVANATLLVVQHAERFGLAQLHQLRGRVGRGQRPGTAILIGEPRTEDASRRLAILEGSASGFEIAEEDLRIRGPGDWLGTRQAGRLPELRLADLVRHAELVEPVREAAARLLASDPGLGSHASLRASVERRWGRRLEFGSVA